MGSIVDFFAKRIDAPTPRFSLYGYCGRENVTSALQTVADDAEL